MIRARAERPSFPARAPWSPQDSLWSWIGPYQSVPSRVPFVVTRRFRLRAVAAALCLAALTATLMGIFATVQGSRQPLPGGASAPGLAATAAGEESPKIPPATP